MATVQCGGPPTRATHVTMPARLLRGDVLQCGAASAGARGRRGVCGEPAHLPLGPSRFSWPPTCCFCAFSPGFSGVLPSRSVQDHLWAEQLVECMRHSEGALNRAQTCVCVCWVCCLGSQKVSSARTPEYRAVFETCRPALGIKMAGESCNYSCTEQLQLGYIQVLRNRGRVSSARVSTGAAAAARSRRADCRRRVGNDSAGPQRASRWPAVRVATCY